jgi:hypothetical protein
VTVNQSPTYSFFSCPEDNIFVKIVARARERLDSNFKLCVFVVNGLIKERLRN